MDGCKRPKHDEHEKSADSSGGDYGQGPPLDSLHFSTNVEDKPSHGQSCQAAGDDLIPAIEEQLPSVWGGDGAVQCPSLSSCHSLVVPELQSHYASIKATNKSSPIWQSPAAATGPPLESDYSSRKANDTSSPTRQSPTTQGAPLESDYSLGKLENKSSSLHQSPTTAGPPMESDYSSMTTDDQSSPTQSPATPANFIIPASDLHSSGEVIGEGSFGKVLKGELQGQPVALKCVKNVQMIRMNKVLDEVRIARTCQHDNVVKLHGMCAPTNELVLVFELMRGGDLFKALREQPKLYSWYNRGRSIAMDIAKGMAYLHSQKVIHCDMKTMNILLDTNGAAKISDLGLAKLALYELVTRNSVRGTWAYMAPEFLHGSKISTKVDIYSFGVILWELVTTEVPKRDQLRTPRVPEECPARLWNVINACLQAEPTDRPTANRIVALLQKI